ncbi:MAG: domain S-box [Verrucomicrobiales bacterium]|nr:domain S-box [Verrucomicrobiales bacterium]
MSKSIVADEICPDAQTDITTAGIPLDHASLEDTTFYFSNDALFQSAFTYGPIGIALVGLQGQWLKVNRSMCQIVGYNEDELLRITFQAITHPDDLDVDLENTRNVVSGKSKTYQMEKRYFHKSGRIVWVLLSVSLVRSRSGTPLFFIAQIQNIDDRKRMEQELIARNEELSAALHQVKELQGIVPICMYCKNIRDDENYWHKVEAYITDHSKAKFSHCVCPECMEKFKRDLLPQLNVKI